MRAKGYLMGTIFIGVSFLFLFSTQCQSSASGKDTVAGIKEKMMVKEGGVRFVSAKEDYARTSLAEQIIADNNSLSFLFRDGSKLALREMAKLCQRLGGSLISDNYEKFLGSNTEAFWQEARMHGDTLEFHTTCVYITDSIGIKTVPAIENGNASNVRFDAAALVIQEIHIITSSGTRTALHNQTIPGGRGYRHKDDCSWGIN